jgi:hypothetical protein
MSSRIGRSFLTLAAACVAGAFGGSPPVLEGPGAGLAVARGDVPWQACDLLTDEQVATVVPGHDGGHDQDTSEASLMKDVSLEHCKYYHGGPEGLVMLDVLVWRASSDEGFEQIAISEWGHSSDTKLDIGDVSFLEDGGGTWTATASKGRTVFELSLMADDAEAKSEQLVELARRVAAKLWS